MSPRTLAAAALAMAMATPGLQTGERAAPPLPTDPSRWVGEPQGWPALRGRVTLVFVWTFG